MVVELVAESSEGREVPPGLFEVVEDELAREMAVSLDEA